jgi:hypothetical protein
VTVAVTWHRRGQQRDPGEMTMRRALVVQLFVPIYPRHEYPELTMSGNCQIASSNTRQPATRVPKAPVKDDWEDDEDDSEDDAPTVERNKQIWEDALVQSNPNLFVIVLNLCIGIPKSNMPCPALSYPATRQTQLHPRASLLKESSTSNPR